MHRWLPTIIALLLGQEAVAQPILHEYVPPPGQDPTSAAARAGRLPSSLRVEDRVLPRPDETPRPAREEPVIGPTAQPDRDAEVRPDRTTTHDGVLKYTAVFNPEVVPFKRMAAMDKVGPRYVLSVRDPTQRPLPLTPVPTPPDRDPFWGSLMLSVERNRPVAIPSVAPEARIISYTATPSAQVTFYKDSADNFWVRSDRAGQLRLVFLTDAPKRYFSPQIPTGVSAAHVPAALRPTLPSAVRDAANKVLEKIQVKPTDPLSRQLDRLVGYFRSFEPGPLPRITGDTYLDIALSGKGVCRHRSLAFVITAHALGIPARYVHNEAHAFTEVFIPRLGWARIDLGGASPQLQVFNGQDKAVHDPGPDPFPRPVRFANNYSQLSQHVTGLRPSQRLRRSDGSGRGGGGGRVNLRVFDRSRGALTDDGPRDRDRTQVGGPETPDSPTTSTDDPDAMGPAAPAKTPTQISIYSGTRAVFRGERIRIWGKVLKRGPGDSGIGNLRVDVYLSRDGQTTDALLGATVSGPDGRFSAVLPVPRGVKVGDYQVYAVTPGDGRHESSLSQ
jgi:transglutaminase-like putative cysteine protease